MFQGAALAGLHPISEGFYQLDQQICESQRFLLSQFDWVIELRSGLQANRAIWIQPDIKVSASHLVNFWG
ncbi:hypothetical protein J2739_002511 [Variovorax soli]|uniref:Uncharacterized protein n=1 Tax=Variovorax soli TaxID=376815 RepID=A0ABU1NE61_9BURK|nr:hypothetical protein [Variovorax soli]